MPTAKPRIAIILPDSTREAFVALAEAQDRPLATVIADLLHEMEPQIISLAKLTEHAKAGRTGQMKQALRHMLGDAMAEVMTASQPELFTAKKAKRK
jgi:hypothetical protein